MSFNDEFTAFCDDLASLAPEAFREVRVQRLVEVDDGAGGFREEWQDLATPKAYCRAMSVTERLSAFREVAKGTWIGWMSLLPELDAGCRILDGGRVMDVSGADPDPDGLRTKFWGVVREGETP